MIDAKIIPIRSADVREIAIHKKSRFRHFVVNGAEVTYRTADDLAFCRKCKSGGCAHVLDLMDSVAVRTPQHIAFAAQSETLARAAVVEDGSHE